MSESGKCVKVEDVREAMEREYGGGLMGYLSRLRQTHAMRLTPTGHIAVCACGEPGCQVAPLLFHIEQLKRSYALKVEDLARETGQAHPCPDEGLREARISELEQAFDECNQALVDLGGPARALLAAVDHLLYAGNPQDWRPVDVAANQLRRVMARTALSSEEES